MSDPATIIRCSALSGWPDCPRRGAARLFRAEIKAAGYKLRSTLKGIGAAIGTAVHKGAEITLIEKAKTGTLPPESVATDAAHATIYEELREGVTFDGPRGMTQNRVQAEYQMLVMTRSYHHQIAPLIDPVQVEERLEAEIAPGLILSGQPDLVAREPGVIRDLKTGARQSTHAPQIGGYSLLARSNDLAIEQGVIDFIQRVPLNHPQPDPVTTEVMIGQAETAAANIVRHIVDDLEVFRHGDAARNIMPGDPWSFIANPNSMLCGAKWCPAHGTEFCREGR